MLERNQRPINDLKKLIELVGQRRVELKARVLLLEQTLPEAANSARGAPVDRLAGAGAVVMLLDGDSEGGRADRGDAHKLARHA